MKKRNYGQRIFSKDSVSANSHSAISNIHEKYEGTIKNRTDALGDHVILVSELKIAVEDLESGASMHEGFAEAAEKLKTILEPIKKCERVPAVNGSKKLLEIIGSEIKNEPNSVKQIREKCFKIKEICGEIESVKRSRDKMYTI